MPLYYSYLRGKYTPSNAPIVSFGLAPCYSPLPLPLHLAMTAAVAVPSSPVSAVLPPPSPLRPAVR
jgi:hypothetical protein